MNGCPTDHGSRLWALITAVVIAIAPHGCHSADDSLAAYREQLSRGLPLESHLDDPVIPDERYGRSSTTIEEALTYLKASFRDGMLHDKSGNEIHFETKLMRRSGVAKKYPPSAVVIRVAD
jgi:hypothetical protein